MSDTLTSTPKKKQNRKLKMKAPSLSGQSIRSAASAVSSTSMNAASRLVTLTKGIVGPYKMSSPMRFIAVLLAVIGLVLNMMVASGKFSNNQGLKTAAHVMTYSLTVIVMLHIVNTLMTKDSVPEHVVIGAAVSAMCIAAASGVDSNDSSEKNSSIVLGSLALAFLISVFFLQYRSDIVAYSTIRKDKMGVKALAYGEKRKAKALKAGGRREKRFKGSLSSDECSEVASLSDYSAYDI